MYHNSPDVGYYDTSSVFVSGQSKITDNFVAFLSAIFGAKNATMDLNKNNVTIRSSRLCYGVFGWLHYGVANLILLVLGAYAMLRNTMLCNAA